MNQLKNEIKRLRSLMLIKETHVKIMEYDLERKYGVALDIKETGNMVEWTSIEGEYDDSTILKIKQALQSYCDNMSKELIVLDNVGW